MVALRSTSIPSTRLPRFDPKRLHAISGLAPALLTSSVPGPESVEEFDRRKQLRTPRCRARGNSDRCCPLLVRHLGFPQTHAWRKSIAHSPVLAEASRRALEPAGMSADDVQQMLDDLVASPMMLDAFS